TTGLTRWPPIETKEADWVGAESLKEMHASIMFMLSIWTHPNCQGFSLWFGQHPCLPCVNTLLGKLSSAGYAILPESGRQPDSPSTTHRGASASHGIQIRTWAPFPLY
ncbi:MAG: hypothetical protein ACLPXB_07380, partial [Thiobacillaceae bacterium]